MTYIWKKEELAAQMHKTRCTTCGGSLELNKCSEAQHWLDYAERRCARRAKAIKGKFVKGKPKQLTNLERRMELGFQAKEVKDTLEAYMKGLVNDNLTMSQQKKLYDEMMKLISLNKKYKKTVCK